MVSRNCERMDVVKQGELRYKSKRFGIPVLRSCYVVLRRLPTPPNVLEKYRRCGSVQGEIYKLTNVRLVNCLNLQPTRRQHGFVVKFSNLDTVVFFCRNHQDANEWVQAIQNLSEFAPDELLAADMRNIELLPTRNLRFSGPCILRLADGGLQVLDESGPSRPSVVWPLTAIRYCSCKDEVVKLCTGDDCETKAGEFLFLVRKPAKSTDICRRITVAMSSQNNVPSHRASESTPAPDTVYPLRPLCHQATVPEDLSNVLTSQDDFNSDTVRDTDAPSTVPKRPELPPMSRVRSLPDMLQAGFSLDPHSGSRPTPVSTHTMPNRPTTPLGPRRTQRQTSVDVCPKRTAPPPPPCVLRHLHQKSKQVVKPSVANPAEPAVREDLQIIPSASDSLATSDYLEVIPSDDEAVTERSKLQQPVPPREKRYTKRSSQTSDRTSVTSRDSGSIEDAAVKTRLIADAAKAAIFRLAGPADMSSGTRSLPAGCGVLLYGPEGYGKRLLANVFADECHAKFLSVQCRSADVLGALRKSLEEARSSTPCVVFMRDIDALSPIGEGREALAEIRRVLDSICCDQRIVLIGSTTCPDKIDASLTSPGRLSEQIYMPPPDVAGRLTIITHELESPSKAVEEELAAATANFTASEVVELCRRTRRLYSPPRSTDPSKPLPRVRRKHLEEIVNEIQSRVANGSDAKETCARYYIQHEGRQDLFVVDLVKNEKLPNVKMCLLSVRSDLLKFYDLNGTTELVKWPLACIRRFGCEHALRFTIETGRSCPQGEGYFVFKTVHADDLRKRLASQTSRVSNGHTHAHHTSIF